ncbi:hypothetical protein TEA_009674 [Camellia sinensis var. sinensis]|uniref:RRM domain-containing protein n=1 Tax=Camellia sinensis var. sinensis TaxID=542762 RepID=A0A4V3WL11_CAMSN|nr:hypothetical protein TEA_009674 [Camellia sinensis var. sinensis]
MDGGQRRSSVNTRSVVVVVVNEHPSQGSSFSSVNPAHLVFKLVMDEKAKRSKGYAFIQYTSQDDALLALESMDHKYFDGRVIFVELAKPGRNAFGVYPKTTGPPQEQNIANQDEATE